MYHVILCTTSSNGATSSAGAGTSATKGGYEGGDDTIASVAAAAEEEAAEAKGRYEGAVSARCSSLALYATGDIGAEPPSAVPSARSSTCYATFSPFALIVSERAGLVGSETSGRFSRRAFCPVGFLFSRHQQGVISVRPPLCPCSPQCTRLSFRAPLNSATYIHADFQSYVQ